MKLFGKIFKRLTTKPGYRVLAIIAAGAFLLYSWDVTLKVTAYVDSDGYIYATQTGSENEINYLDVPYKLTNSNAINFDVWEFDSEK